MAELRIIAGRTGSGKTNTANEWRAIDPDNREVLEEFQFTQIAHLRRLIDVLESGRDVAVTVNAAPDEAISYFAGYGYGNTVQISFH